jgi:TRAP-type C4-dicarboxylate transport system permease small subunit
VRRVSFVINRLLSYVAAGALGLLMFLTVADIVGRYVFSRPVPGTFELTEMSMVFIVFLALGLAQHDNEHISLDLAYNYFSSRLKRFIDYFADLINLVVVAAVTWQLFEYSMRMAEGNYTTAVLKLPIHPFVLVAVAGTFAYVLAIIADFGRSTQKREGV